MSGCITKDTRGMPLHQTVNLNGSLTNKLATSIQYLTVQFSIPEGAGLPKNEAGTVSLSICDYHTSSARVQINSRRLKDNYSTHKHTPHKHTPTEETQDKRQKWNPF